MEDVREEKRTVFKENVFTVLQKEHFCEDLSSSLSGPLMMKVLSIILVIMSPMQYELQFIYHLQDVSAMTRNSNGSSTFSDH